MFTSGNPCDSRLLFHAYLTEQGRCLGAKWVQRSCFSRGCVVAKSERHLASWRPWTLTRLETNPTEAWAPSWTTCWDCPWMQRERVGFRNFIFMTGQRSCEDDVTFNMWNLFSCSLHLNGKKARNHNSYCTSCSHLWCILIMLSTISNPKILYC